MTFVLLHNIALITKHDADYAKKHGMPVSTEELVSIHTYKAGNKEPGLTASAVDAICTGGQCQGVQLR